MRYVFGGSGEPTDEEIEDSPLKPHMTNCAFFQNRLVTSCGGFPFSMKLNGGDSRADGVTCVGTDPGHRRRGLVRHLITERLQLAHNDGIPAAILWASLGAIYQRFGYGLATSGYTYKFNPRLAEFQFDSTTPKGWVRLMGLDDALPVVQSVYKEFIQSRNLMLHRPEDHWKAAYRSKKNKFHFAVYYNEDGVSDGFFNYRIKEADNTDLGPYQQLNVYDFVYRNTDAYRGLWEFLRGHDLVKQVRMMMPADDPALFMLLDPRILRAEWMEGIWMRVVDVERLASCRKFDCAGRTSFEIGEDNECPWNIGKFEIESDGQNSRVSKTSSGPDFRISINGLASLLSGNVSLSVLCASGRASIDDPGRLPELDRFFATRYKPFCIDDF